MQTTRSRGRVAVGGLLLTLALVAGPAHARERGEDELRRDMEFAKQQVYPALVNISVVARGHSAGRSRRFPAAGSGVIVSPAGHVVTNYHVAGEATRIVCRLPSQESIPAEVVAHDPLTDLSVLRLQLETRKDRNHPLPFARLGDSDALQTGDYVLAMGNPLTLSSSMTLGIVSNPKRVFASFTGAEIGELDLGEGQKTGLFTRWIQHDALILPGNSGGPLVNLKGEVVGINELGGGGVGFAIPSKIVSWVLNQALSYGEIRRGWLGVEFAHTEKAGGRGALVGFVEPGGPAARAGLQAGDRILTVDGEVVEGRHIEQLPLLYAHFSRYAPGTEILLSIERSELRGDRIRKMLTNRNLRVGRMEKYLADEQEDKRLGLTVRDITGPMALLRRYPDEEGVLVTGIRPGHPAEDAKPRLQPGDVIREIAGQPIADYDAYRRVLGEKADAEKLAVRVRRKAQDVLTVLDVSKKERPKGGGELPKPWIGVRTQVVTPDVAEAMGLEKVKGFRVTEVFPETKAQAAGLRVGDVVTAIDDKALNAYRLQDGRLFRRRVERLTIGERAKLSLLRDGAETEVLVTLEETPQTTQEVETAEDEVLEYKVRDITFGDRVDEQWGADQYGVVVTQVTGGGWAQLAGLQAGDLLLKVNGRYVADVEGFEASQERIAETKPSPISLFVQRGYRTKILFAEPEYEE